MAVAERQAEAHQFLAQSVARKPGVEFTVAQVISIVQEQAAFPEFADELPKFERERCIIEFLRRRQVEAILDQGVERTYEAVRFKREYVFQKCLFDLGIAICHFATDHFAARHLVHFAAKFFNADFAINAFEAERVVIGFVGHDGIVTRRLRKAKSCLAEYFTPDFAMNDFACPDGPDYSACMAFRIHDSVVRGEIDNRVKGIVRGQIWVAGRTEPVTLELKGNAHRDLAGCLLTFTNPLERISPAQLASLNPLQRGSIGDLTASRKVRVFDVPLAEALEMIHRKEEPPEHMANSLYLEWFSEANGRVVVESADYELTISPPEWRLTAEEEEQRARAAAAGMDDFMGKLTEAIEQHQHGQKAPEADWDEHDYEKLLKESDARTDKYMELLEKYGDSDEAEEKIANEMGWDREDGNDDRADEERMSVEEINRICEEAANEPPPEPEPQREGIDWIRTGDGDLRHPIQHRCFESAIKFWHQANDLGMERLADRDLHQFIFEFQTTGAKLAGALNGIARGQGASDAAFTVACLKRALDHLHKSQAGLEAVAPKQLLPATLIGEARQELFEIREGILSLMDKFRGRP